jgi:hypothetical protein
LDSSFLLEVIYSAAICFTWLVASTCSIDSAARRQDTLLEEDALLIETAYQQMLQEIASPSAALTHSSAQTEVSVRSAPEDPTAGFAFPKDPVRRRS